MSGDAGGGTLKWKFRYANELRIKLRSYVVEEFCSCVVERTRERLATLKICSRGNGV